MGCLQRMDGGALLLAATVGYLFISMKRVYKRNVWRTLLNMVMLIALYALVMTTVVLVALLALA